MFLNAVFWKLRTGVPWRDLPPQFGCWNNVWRRFQRWRELGVWEKLLAQFADEPDFEWLMIDASHIKAHPHASGLTPDRHPNRQIELTLNGLKLL